MDYSLILPKDIFLWRAVSDSLRHEVHLPPDAAIASLPSLEGLPPLSPDLKRQIALESNWRSLPQQRLSGCEFLDTVAQYIHKVGIISATNVAYNLKVKETDVRGAFLILTGMSVREWSAQYTHLMVADLQRRTRLSLVQISKELRFPTPHALVLFLGGRRG